MKSLPLPPFGNTRCYYRRDWTMAQAECNRN
jgi:hypothetical protein